MRFPTAIVAATAMIALTFVQVPANATPPCDSTITYENPCCNVAPNFLWCAFDNHLLSDPTEPLMVNIGEVATSVTGVNTPMPSAFAGCSATERQLYAQGLPNVPIENWGNPATQVLHGMGGCLALQGALTSASVHDHAWYHVDIASLAGADDAGFLIGEPQVCFYDASHTVIACHVGFHADDTACNNSCGVDDSVSQLIYHQCIPAGAAYVDIEHSSVGVSVLGAFWQDKGFADASQAGLCDNSYN